MHIRSFSIANFRRLKDVRIDLEKDTSIFVGANNSGKTSATHIFQLFLGSAKGNFTIYDFTADCWTVLNQLGEEATPDLAQIPSIQLDLWFDVDDANLHRVVDLLPSLEWDGEPVGVRLTYGPKDADALFGNYRAAREKAQPPVVEGNEAESSYRPWPSSMTDYLSKRLKNEYEIQYGILDRSQFDDALKCSTEYRPYPLGDSNVSGARIMDSLIRVDCLDAQRHLSDTDSKGRTEDLSKRLSRFYNRNLAKRDDDFEALRALADSEARLNAHFAQVFKPTLSSLSALGYPGVSNPDLIIKSTLNAESMLNGNARVHYALPSSTVDASLDEALTLPDQYNGLGFKNLIYMVIEMLDFHHSWLDLEEARPPLHLVIIEEPEAHLHAQLQQVFIRKITEILPVDDASFLTQMLVTTHSPHIIYERSFRPVRYFRRADRGGEPHYTDVRNLSIFYDQEEKPTRDFLLQYMKLTHCDLFFGDAAILVEGNVERLLVPLMIQKIAPELRSCHLTILEVGGAFAHKFRKLIEFLDLTTLVVTDLDSVHGEDLGETADEEEDSEDSVSSKACMANVDNAVTSNETLRQWAPGRTLVSELLTIDSSEKNAKSEDGRISTVRVAYQTTQNSTWKGATVAATGRTFEEAFALENLEWTQDISRKHLGLRVVTKSSKPDFDIVAEKLFNRVKSFDKTKFALGLMAESQDDWVPPAYISEGLQWLSKELALNEVVPLEGLEPEVTK